MVQIKNNLAAFGHSKAFRVTETGFEWIGDYEITADEVLGGIAPKVNKLEQAKKMLRELAETSTSVQSSEIFDMAEDLNISKRTLENAKRNLKLRQDESAIPGIVIYIKSSWNKLRMQHCRVYRKCGIKMQGCNL